MDSGINNGGHSAEVKIQLLLDGNAFPVAQLGPDFLLIDVPFDYPPGKASLILQVDKAERRWEICLEKGVSAGESRVLIRSQPSCSTQ